MQALYLLITADSRNQHMLITVVNTGQPSAIKQVVTKVWKLI